MKKNKLFSFMMLMILSVTLVSCGGDNEVDGNVTSDPFANNGVTGTVVNDSSISEYQNFENNVRAGNFKAPKYSSSKFDYLVGTATTNNTNNYGFTSYFYCTFCSNYQGSSSYQQILTRTINTSWTSVTRTGSEDTGFSSDLNTLKGELGSLIQRARAHSNSQDPFIMKIRNNAYIMKVYSVNSSDPERFDGYEYVIDLEKPLAANPVYRRDLSTNETYDYMGEYNF